MKNLYCLSPKAYKEGYEVLRSLPKSEQEKIPTDIWQFIKKHMDLQYNFSLNEFSQDSLLLDTNRLLAIIYKTYFATDSEKKVIHAKEMIVKKEKELEAFKKYNPKNLFKKS